MREPWGIAPLLDDAMAATPDRDALLVEVAEILRPFLVRYFEARTRNLPGFDVEAMASEVVLRIVRTWARIELANGMAGVGYAFTIARNHLVDEVRRWEYRRRIGIETMPVDVLDDWEDDVDWRRVARAPEDVEAEVVGGDARDRLFATVGACAPGGEWLVELAAGQSYREIARRHGVTEKAVKAKLWRARQAARACLDERDWR